MAIRQRGRGFQVYWINPHTKAMESKTFDTMTKAEEFDSQIKHNLKFNRELFQKKSTGTLEELVLRYLAHSKPVGLNTTLRAFRIFLNAVGNVQADALSKADIVKFANTQRKDGIKPATILRRLSTAKAAYNWAVENGELDSTPFSSVKLHRGRSERFAPPTMAEVNALLKNAPKTVYRSIIVGLYTGVRMGPCELLKLKWTDYDKDRGVLRVWSADKNTDKPYRDVPVHPVLAKNFEEWEKDGSEWIIHRGGAQIKSSLKSWYDTKRRAGITRRLRIYDMRHAFATNALAAGADVLAVADIMGHADASMVLKVYGHVLGESKAKAVNILPVI